MINPHNVFKDPDTGDMCVVPFGLTTQDSYLILVDGEGNANHLKTELSMGRFPTPLQSPDKYEKIGLHVNGKTPIFKFKE